MNQQQNNRQSESRIPEFSSREEMAEWFDTHDMGDYLDEFDVIDSRDVDVADNLSEVVTIRLSPEMLVNLRRQAQEKGLGASTLARMWILEHLRRDSEEAERRVGSE